MPEKRFQAILVQDETSAACGIQLPFDPCEEYGKARAPVRVTINQFTFRTTTATMRGASWIPVNRENRAGAGIQAGATVIVHLELDTEPRVITPPRDLVKALRANPVAHAAWKSLSFTHQREYVRAVEETKRPETRQRRIAKTIHTLTALLPGRR